MNVLIKTWSDLSDDQKDLFQYGEDDNYLIVENDDGAVVRIETDGMEPEDTVFYRDLYWIVEALQQAYTMGRKSVDVN